MRDLSNYVALLDACCLLSESEIAWPSHFLRLIFNQIRFFGMIPGFQGAIPVFPFD